MIRKYRGPFQFFAYRGEPDDDAMTLLSINVHKPNGTLKLRSWTIFVCVAGLHVGVGIRV